jgi:hypothetical protein
MSDETAKGSEPASSDDASQIKNAADEEPPKSITFVEFLESRPPSQMDDVIALFGVETSPAGRRYLQLRTPDLKLYCSTEICAGVRVFRRIEDLEVIEGETSLFLSYLCSNCQKQKKIYSLHVVPKEPRFQNAGRCYKYGELPMFGPHTPARLMRMLGAESQYFLKGRRCETQGLGIGAFAYYRRVVENQKNQIIGEIVRVSEKIGAPREQLQKLEEARNETRFSAAVSLVKDALPPVLLINGQNPLTLLHTALSDGVHDQTDKHCLELAHDIRVVLVELSDRLGQALKDEAELSAAVGRLMNIRQNG